MRPLPHPSRLSPPPAFNGLSDAEWAALLPYLLHRSPQGRPLPELRQRMEGIFHIAASHAPWRHLPEAYGKAGTVSRYFRRLTHAGLWQRLLAALAEAGPRHPLQGLRHVICRACRRALRIAGLSLLLLARKLEIRQAMPAPPWMLPDPHLSETCSRALAHFTRPGAPPGALAAALPSLRQLTRNAAGRRRIPRSVRLGWA